MRPLFHAWFMPGSGLERAAAGPACAPAVSRLYASARTMPGNGALPCPPMPTMTPRLPATLIAGDGIGPEIVDATLAALDALQAPFDWDHQAAGPGRHQSRRRPAASRHTGQHPAHPAGAEGAAGNTLGRRLPVIERAPARSLPAVRQPAPGAHHRARWPLRQDRPRRGAREPRRPVHRPRTLRADRRGPARRGHGHRHQHPRGQPPAAGIRLPARGGHRPQEGEHRAQGQHHEGAHGHLPGDRPGAVRTQVQGPVRTRHRDHRCLRDEAGAEPLAIRHAGDDQPLRRHPVRPGGRPGGRPGHGPRCQHRRRRRDLRGRARLGTRHRRQGHRQPHRAAAGRRHDAGPRTPDRPGHAPAPGAARHAERRPGAHRRPGRQRQHRSLHPGPGQPHPQRLKRPALQFHTTNEEQRHETTRRRRPGRSPFRHRHLRRQPGRHRTGRTGRHRDEGSRGALGRGPQGHPVRDRGQHHPHREALRLRRPRGVDPGRPVARQRGHGREPAVCLGPAGHRHERSEHPAGRRRLRRGRRRGSDEPRRLPVAGDAQRRTHGRHHPHRHHGRDADRPLRRGPHGHHRREPGREVGHHARGTGRARRRIAPPRSSGHRRGPLQVADRSHRQADAQGRSHLRHRRAREGVDDDGDIGEDEAGVQEGRLGDRRQCLGHQRRRRLLRDGRRRRGRCRRPQADGAAGGLCRGRRAQRRDGRRPDPGDQGSAEEGRHDAGPDGRDREQRSLRRAGHHRGARTGVRHEEGQPERRRHRARPPHRLLGRLPGHQGHLRTAPQRRPLRAGDDVHRRRPGHRRGVREALSAKAPTLPKPAQHVKPFVQQDEGGKALRFSIRDVQSRMRLADPDALDLEYSRTMMAFLLFQAGTALHRDGGPGRRVFGEVLPPPPARQPHRGGRDQPACAGPARRVPGAARRRPLQRRARRRCLARARTRRRLRCAAGRRLRLRRPAAGPELAGLLRRLRRPAGRGRHPRRQPVQPGTGTRGLRRPHPPQLCRRGAARGQCRWCQQRRLRLQGPAAGPCAGTHSTLAQGPGPSGRHAADAQLQPRARGAVGARTLRRRPATAPTPTSRGTQAWAEPIVAKVAALTAHHASAPAQSPSNNARGRPLRTSMQSSRPSVAKDRGIGGEADEFSLPPRPPGQRCQQRLATHRPGHEPPATGPRRDRPAPAAGRAAMPARRGPAPARRRPRRPHPSPSECSRTAGAGRTSRRLPRPGPRPANTRARRPGLAGAATTALPAPAPAAARARATRPGCAVRTAASRRAARTSGSRRAGRSTTRSSGGPRLRRASQRRDVGGHAGAQGRVGQAALRRAHVLAQVRHLAGGRDGTGHGRMRDHELQGHLGPAVAVDLGRPPRQAVALQRVEQRALAEGSVDDDGNATFLRQRQQPLFGFAVQQGSG